MEVLFQERSFTTVEISALEDVHKEIMAKVIRCHIEDLFRNIMMYIYKHLLSIDVKCKFIIREGRAQMSYSYRRLSLRPLRNYLPLIHGST